MNTVEAIKYFFLEAGAGWVLWLLFALSIASVAVALERWFAYRKADEDVHAIANELSNALQSDDASSAMKKLASHEGVAARIASAGLSVAERGPEAAESAMKSRTALERNALENRLAFLATLGNNAPFIGLFGTVIGIIGAFEELGHSAAGHVNASNASASTAVMSSIAEALVATAVGIAVALPAVAAYNYLQRRVERIVSDSDVLSNLVMAYLKSE
ncbi:MAG: MotA/TolQ/ExbB proton channel family protein [Polyangiales bacterium]